MAVACWAAEYRLVPCDNLLSILEQVDQGILEVGVVPVENSIEGSVAVVWDTLTTDVNLSIIGELVLPIEQNLLAAKKVPLEVIKQVMSHPQALAQCRRYLQENLPQAVQVAVSSTSCAARLVAQQGDFQQDNLSAAIGNRLAAELYGLEVLASGIQDNQFNTTRFIVVSKSDGDLLRCQGRGMKTSLVFTTMTERAGILYETLWEFASRQVNLTRIESRPAKKSLGEYFFYVDIEGGLDDSKVAEACAAVAERAKFLKVLGSYPILDV